MSDADGARSRRAARRSVSSPRDAGPTGSHDVPRTEASGRQRSDAKGSSTADTSALSSTVIIGDGSERSAPDEAPDATRQHRHQRKQTAPGDAVPDSDPPEAPEHLSLESPAVTAGATATAGGSVTKISRSGRTVKTPTQFDPSSDCIDILSNSRQGAQSPARPPKPHSKTRHLGDGAQAISVSSDADHDVTQVPSDTRDACQIARRDRADSVEGDAARTKQDKRVAAAERSAETVLAQPSNTKTKKSKKRKVAVATAKSMEFVDEEDMIGEQLPQPGLTEPGDTIAGDLHTRKVQREASASDLSRQRDLANGADPPHPAQPVDGAALRAEVPRHNDITNNTTHPGDDAVRPKKKKKRASKQIIEDVGGQPVFPAPIAEAERADEVPKVNGVPLQTAEGGANDNKENETAGQATPMPVKAAVRKRSRAPWSITALCAKHTNGSRPSGLSRRHGPSVSLLMTRREVQSRPPVPVPQPKKKKKKAASDDDGSDIESAEVKALKRVREGWSEDDEDGDYNDAKAVADDEGMQDD